MAELFQDKQKNSAAAADIQNILRRRAMQVQVLHAFDVEFQIAFQVEIFGVILGRGSVSRLDIVQTIAINFRQQRPQRNRTEPTLYAPPSAPVSQRLSELF